MRALAAVLLWTLGTSSSVAVASPAADVQELLEALRSDSRGERLHAAIALGELGKQPEDAVPALIATLRDSEINVRCAAAWSLGKFGPAAAEAVRPLMELVDHEHIYLRRWSIDSLGEIGPSAAEAVPLLEEAARSDTDHSARRRAEQALLRIRGTKPPLVALD